jgi:membrane protein DedA with SNARE-associated domain
MFDWITGWLEGGGYFGVFALMLVENVFPPIPSELVMPLAGYLAAQGKLSLVGVIAAGTLGSVAGALLWYWVGRRIGLDRLRRFARNHGHWLTMDEAEVDRASGWFDRYGWWAVFVGRMVPAVRTLISVPAGIAAMQLVPFLAVTTAGSALWVTFLTLAGYLLEGQFERVEGWLNPVSNAVVAGIVLWYAYRVIRGYGRRQRG